MTPESAQSKPRSGASFYRNREQRDHCSGRLFGIGTGTPVLSDDEPKIASSPKRPRQCLERLRWRAQISAWQTKLRGKSQPEESWAVLRALVFCVGLLRAGDARRPFCRSACKI